MSTSITNFASQTRTGFIRLAPNGLELFGTVIRAGKMEKTVTVRHPVYNCQVRVSRYSYNHKIKLWLTRSKNIHCHDEEEFCQTGDKVVIRNCRKMSKIKSFFVRNIVLPVGRQNMTGEPSTQYEEDALAYNLQMRSKPLKQWF